jgi:hypothetical protein
MLPIDHHVQRALYTFDRDMKRLTHGTKRPSPAGPGEWLWKRSRKTFLTGLSRSVW